MVLPEGVDQIICFNVTITVSRFRYMVTLSQGKKAGFIFPEPGFLQPLGHGLIFKVKLHSNYQKMKNTD